MQHFPKITLLHTFPIALCVCFFALICLTSVSHASSPPADSVHVCLPFDYEQWRRDHPRPAAKRLANLNVGEPRTVRMIYFLPNDRPFQQAVVDSMKVTIRQIQTFFADQMEAHGYGRKTFRFETDAQGEPIVHRVDGQHPDSYYIDSGDGDYIEEIGQQFSFANVVQWIVWDNSIGAIRRGVSGIGWGNRNRGFALVSQYLLGTKFHRETVAHELGHAFGLGHDWRDRNYIMSYGHGRSSLSACAAEFLSVHPFFNPDIPDEETPGPTIELISSPGYPTGSTSVSIQLKVSDPDGLHQVLLFVGSDRSDSGLKACRSLNSETDAIVQFDYDGVIPSSRDPYGTGTSLSDPLVHLIHVEAVDTEGNVRNESFSLVDVATIRGNIATLEGHTDLVRSVSFSPDGTTLASGSYDRTVKLWDVASRTNIATLEGHTSGVTSGSFSPDGTTLASGSRDSTVKLWDVASRTNIATLEGHKGSVWSVSFSPDGRTLASGSYDSTVKLWDVASRTNIATLEGHTGLVWSVSFSPDGTTLASGSYDRTVKLWDVATQSKLAILAHTGDVDVWSVSFSPDGTTLASGSDYRTVKLWDTSEWLRPRPSALMKISGDNQQGAPDAALANPLVVELRDQYGVALPLKGVPVTFTVTAGNGKLGGRFTVENTTTDVNGRAQSTLTLGPAEGTNTVEVSGTGLVPVTFNAVGVGTPAIPIMGGDYQKWHLPDGAIVRLGKGAISTDDRAVAFSPDGQYLAVASGIGVWLYEMATSRPLALLPTGDSVWSVVFSPDGRTLASVLANSRIELWEVENLTKVATLEGHRWSIVTSVVFSPDGTMLASGSWDDTVKLWDVASQRAIATLEGHTEWVTSVSFSPDGSILASGSGDATIKLWDVSLKRDIATLEGHTEWVTSVSFSPDGSTLASGSGDATVKLWDVASQRAIATLEGHKGSVRSVVFSPDGRTLASGSYDSTVKLWDVASQRNIATLEGHKSVVRSVVFSPDGTILASGSDYGVSRSYDGMVLLWDMSPHITPQTPDPDFNGDGMVNISDFLLFADQFGLSQGDAGYDARYDLDGDGTIGIGDFLIFGEAFG